MNLSVRNLVCCVQGRIRLTIFKDRVLWKIFGHQTEEVRENWGKMSKEELHGLYTSVNTMIKSREKRWMEMWNVWDRSEMLAEIWWGNLQEGKHLEGLGLGRGMILKWEMSLEEEEWEDMECIWSGWVLLTQQWRFWVSQNVESFLTVWGSVTLSKTPLYGLSYFII